MNLKSSDIYYSQDSISHRFGDNTNHRGKRIGETLDDIINGRCKVSSIPVIEVKNFGGKWYNRRLWVFKHLQRLGRCEYIPVRRCRHFNTKKFTTRNGGVDVRVRGDGPGGICYLLSSPSTRTLEDTVCITKSSTPQLGTSHLNVYTPKERPTSNAIARNYQPEEEFKTDNALYAQENWTTYNSASIRSDVKLKNADYLTRENPQAIGFSDRTHDTHSSSSLAMHYTNNDEINESKTQRSYTMSFGIVNESLQRISIFPIHAVQSSSKSFTTLNAETRTQAYLENRHSFNSSTDIKEPSAKRTTDVQR
ncbi:uncharacterized protein LOC127864350 [Dreissena polymorpha]|uniref:Uncharacterized protein n=1 Tax=Dreissena polymorpha TaxID=45954 RepID=A0A9D4NLV9_DREPO|nr:uncharacterized protein LOC127864350 [Dreissena polymorpha]KAH3896109.1 hypothetical protein DPMN_020282 [Dreissena polymorpha]